MSFLEALDALASEVKRSKNQKLKQLFLDYTLSLNRELAAYLLIAKYMRDVMPQATQQNSEMYVARRRMENGEV